MGPVVARNINPLRGDLEYEVSVKVVVSFI